MRREGRVRRDIAAEWTKSMLASGRRRGYRRTARRHQANLSGRRVPRRSQTLRAPLRHRDGLRSHHRCCHCRHHHCCCCRTRGLFRERRAQRTSAQHCPAETLWRLRRRPVWRAGRLGGVAAAQGTKARKQAVSGEATTRMCEKRTPWELARPGCRRRANTHAGVTGRALHYVAQANTNQDFETRNHFFGCSQRRKSDAVCSYPRKSVRLLADQKKQTVPRAIEVSPVFRAAQHRHPYPCHHFESDREPALGCRPTGCLRSFGSIQSGRGPAT